MTLRARHRLGVILGACSRGWGRFWPPKSIELARAGPGVPRRHQWRGAPARRRMARVCASTRQTPKQKGLCKPLCAMFECGQKLVLRRRGLMGGRPL